MLDLNSMAWELLQGMVKDKDILKLKVHKSKGGALLVDAGIENEGSISAGIMISKMLLSGLADVRVNFFNGMSYVQVISDHPLLSCMASQYAGWKILVGKFNGMGSGPARILGSKEPIMKKFGWSAKHDKAVLFIESRQIPEQEVVEYISESCKVKENAIGIVFAPSGSIVGSIQVPARVVETGLHKMMEIGYNVSNIVSAIGTAPIPPVGKNDLEAIGRLNDAIIYGGEIVYVVKDDKDILEFLKKIPSCNSKDYGQPFMELFRSVGGDFYQIDPLIFSPASVTMVSLSNGKSFRAGSIDGKLLKKSFGL